MKCCDLCKDDTSCLYSLDENSIIYHIYFWEQRKLNEYLEVSRAKNKDEVFGKEDVLSVSGDYGIVNQIEFQGRSFAGVSVAPYGVVETGDVVYTKSPLKSNPYGIIKTNKGKPGIVSTLYAVYKPQDNVYSEFVQIYFEQDARMNNYMHPLVNKGAKNDMKVSDENALKGEVCFPNRDEQIKISEYFAKLDHLITLHQHKRNKVSYVKSTFSTLFWEQRKFEEAFIERREKTEMENEDTLLSCAINGIFLNSELFGHFRGTTTIGYLKVKKNDLILSAQNLHLGNANVNLRFEHGIISPAYKVYDLNNCNPEFVQAWVKKEDTKNFFLAATTEGASQCRKNIEWSTLAKQFIAMPTLQEQSVIGTFFANLDHLITLHQRKMKYILKEVFIWIILIKRVVLKKPLSLSYRIMVGRKRLLSILQNRI